MSSLSTMWYLKSVEIPITVCTMYFIFIPDDFITKNQSRKNASVSLNETILYTIETLKVTTIGAFDSIKITPSLNSIDWICLTQNYIAFISKFD